MTLCGIAAMEGRYNGSGRTKKKTETTGFRDSFQTGAPKTGSFRIKRLQTRQPKLGPKCARRPHQTVGAP